MLRIGECSFIFIASLKIHFIRNPCLVSIHVHKAAKNIKEKKRGRERERDYLVGRSLQEGERESERLPGWL